ncbi:hypothetical protein CsSME_00008179 [Camellia sinensis var. sinensis]
MTPYSLVFEGPHRPRPRETLLRLRQYFDTVRHSEITWQPWVSLGDGLRLQYTGASGISQYRVLLEGPVGRVWFLGERFLRQVWGYLSQDIPAVPPASMRTADRLSYSEVVGAMLCSDALLYIEEGDYATYRHIYLMPPLTGAHIPMMRPAGMSSSDQARARAADVLSTSRAGTSRGGSRPVPLAPSVHPHPGWPDMPTELMAWQYGASSPTPIPLEPPMPSDRYTIDPDSPPPSRGYMEEVVGLVATLEGMVLRREAQLSVAGIQMPSWSGQPQTRPAGPHWGAGHLGLFKGRGHLGLPEDPGHLGLFEELEEGLSADAGLTLWRWSLMRRRKMLRRRRRRLPTVSQRHLLRRGAPVLAREIEARLRGILRMTALTQMMVWRLSRRRG